MRRARDPYGDRASYLLLRARRVSFPVAFVSSRKEGSKIVEQLRRRYSFAPRSVDDESERGCWSHSHGRTRARACGRGMEEHVTTGLESLARDGENDGGTREEEEE